MDDARIADKKRRYTPKAFADFTGTPVRDVLLSVEKAQLQPSPDGFEWDDLLAAINDFSSEKAKSDLADQLRLFKMLMPVLAAEISQTVTRDLEVFKGMMEFWGKRVQETLGTINIASSELSAFASGATALFGQVTVLGAAELGVRRAETALSMTKPSLLDDGLKNESVEKKTSEPESRQSKKTTKRSSKEIPETSSSEGGLSEEMEGVKKYFDSFSSDEYRDFFQTSKMSGPGVLTLLGKQFLETRKDDILKLISMKELSTDYPLFRGHDFFQQFFKAFPSLGDCPTGLKGFHISLAPISQWALSKIESHPPGLLWLAILKNLSADEVIAGKRSVFLPNYEMWQSFLKMWQSRS